MVAIIIDQTIAPQAVQRPVHIDRCHANGVENWPPPEATRSDKPQ